MRVKKSRLYFVWQYQKEEKWLNEMAAKGLQLVAPGILRYNFEEGPPEGYVYRLELLEEWPTTSASRNYIHFLEDTGVEYLGSVMRWGYFRKKADDGQFEMYSDIDSKIKHLRRIMVMLLVVGLGNIPLMVNTLFSTLAVGVPMLWPFALLQLAMISLLFYGSFRLWRMVSALKKDRTMQE